jgi:hypothetical protein
MISSMEARRRAANWWYWVGCALMSFTLVEATKNFGCQSGCTMTAASWRIFSTFSMAARRCSTSTSDSASSSASSNSLLA